jgi:hypothetical protein
MIRLAMSVSFGGHMARFRRIMVGVLQQTNLILHGRCSEDALQFRKTAIRLFMSRGETNPIKRFLLQFLPNGDWRREDRIEVWLPHGVQADHQFVVNSVASGMTFALASRQFKLWPRHRWLGADVACDELGLLESCHRLLTTVFIKYCASFGGAKKNAAG